MYQLKVKLEKEKLSISEKCQSKGTIMMNFHQMTVSSITFLFWCFGIVFI
jgi:hypothetical protein